MSGMRNWRRWSSYWVRDKWVSEVVQLQHNVSHFYNTGLRYGPSSTRRTHNSVDSLLGTCLLSKAFGLTPPGDLQLRHLGPAAVLAWCPSDQIMVHWGGGSQSVVILVEIVVYRRGRSGGAVLEVADEFDHFRWDQVVVCDNLQNWLRQNLWDWQKRKHSWCMGIVLSHF